MATVYSLVCFGGRLGKTVTFTDAGDIVNLTNHGLRTGTGVVFSTNGTLPTGITEGVTYYVKQGADQNKFLLYPTQTDAIAGSNQVLIYGTGTGTHKVKSAWMLGLSDLSRWGDPGSERIYDGLASWNSGRSGASPYDVEVCEIGEAFSDINTAPLTITVPSSQNIIHTRIGGTRSSAWHGGIYPTTTLGSMILSDPYIYYCPSMSPSGSIITLIRYRDCIDGITIVSTSNGGISYAVDLAGPQAALYNSILVKVGTSGTGPRANAALTAVVGNLIVGWTLGVAFATSVSGLFICNNTISKCNQGITGTNTVKGFLYNNIVVGNTTNWVVTTSTSLEGASSNAGESGNTIWTTGGQPTITMTTSNFADWANNDYRAALSSSPQVEAGVSPYGFPTTDLADMVRPAYMGVGGTPITDIGAYEFDHGFGPWPASYTITFTGLPVGTDIVILVAGTSTIIEQQDSNPTTSFSFTYGAAQVVDVGFINPGYNIYYLRNLSLGEYNSFIPVSLTNDRNYS